MQSMEAYASALPSPPYHGHGAACMFASALQTLPWLGGACGTIRRFIRARSPPIWLPLIAIRSPPHARPRARPMLQRMARSGGNSCKDLQPLSRPQDQLAQSIAAGNAPCGSPAGPLLADRRPLPNGRKATAPPNTVIATPPFRLVFEAAGATLPGWRLQAESWTALALKPKPSGCTHAQLWCPPCS